MLSSEALKSLAKGAALMPQEEMLEVGRKKQQLYIGIPKETSFQENRVALVPDAVGLLVSRGHRVVIETQAGKMSSFEDQDYSETGAEIAHDAEAVYKADIILKVAPPSENEIELMQRKQILMSALQLTVQPKNFLKKLMAKKISAIAWDYIKDEEGIYPVIRSMGEIAGTTSILIAAEYLSNANDGQGLMLGGTAGVTPAEVVVLGAGTVGELAARSAIGLGATVKVFDNSIYKLRRLQNDLGMRLFTSIVQPTVLEKHLKTADAVIGAIRGNYGRTPCVVNEEMVKKMKGGSVIIDVSIDQGGCFETSRVTNHTKPTFTEYGVIHYCVPNIASRVSKTASYALSNIFAPILLQIGDEGGVEEISKREIGFRDSMYLYNGILTNKILGDYFGLPHKDLGLIFSAL